MMATLNDDSNWQLLTEVLIPSGQGVEAQVADHIAGILQQFGLEPGQLGPILSAVNRALQNPEGSLTPLPIRISVSGLDLEGKPPENGPDKAQVSKHRGRGLSFFLVKRIVGQLSERQPEEYRLLEVLIYRE
jgi:hypothetical protein